jgi:germination protein M
LYFQSQTADHQAYFVPVTRMIERTDDIALATMEQLIKGPNSLTKLAPVIVPDAAVLKMVKTDDVISVHMNEKIFATDNKVPDESLQSVILSLTETTGASKVQILVNSHVEVNSTENVNYSTPVTRPEHVNQIEL